MLEQLTSPSWNQKKNRWSFYNTKVCIGAKLSFRYVVSRALSRWKGLLTLSQPKVSNANISHKVQFFFNVKCWKTNSTMWKYCWRGFHLNGHKIGFSPQTLKVRTALSLLVFSFFQNLALSNLFERWFCYASFGHRTRLIPSASPFPDSEAKDLELRFATALKGF